MSFLYTTPTTHGRLMAGSSTGCVSIGNRNCKRVGCTTHRVNTGLREASAEVNRASAAPNARSVPNIA
eukprot:822961-Rhodomonas_salina.5